MNPTGQIIAETFVALARLALFAYAIQSGRSFLLHWLDTRAGQPLFTAKRIANRQEAIDAARRFAITEQDAAPVTKNNAGTRTVFTGTSEK